MNAFLSTLDKHDIKRDILRRGDLTTLQVNMGDLCNQSCAHCHIEASPQGKNIMSRKVVDDILEFLKRNELKALDITGGAPELNPNFDHLVTFSRPFVEDLIVRSNLTVLFERGKEGLPQFFKVNKVHLVCSMPCYTAEDVDRQRGAGVFEKSIRALKLLNEAGFARDRGLQMDLVYNPVGAYLPSPQGALEKDYKKALEENYGIEFNRLLVITNVAIRKFRKYLESNNEYERYSIALERNFNPATLKDLMCHTFLSVGHDGKLYDCDFNLALGYGFKDAEGDYLTIGRLSLNELDEREISTGEHCLACTAGSGSSCQGALTNEKTCFPEKMEEDKKDAVKEYYGKILKSQKDLKTSACCSTEVFPEPIKLIIKNIEPEILDKFYGCGSPIPPLLEGCRLLDMGSGSGRDVYTASALVGERGFVMGIDMTDEQLEIARRHKDAQMTRFGFKHRNVDFKKGYIEDLKDAGIGDDSQDVVISNCVINLSPDKERVFSEIFRVLKRGGELYFSDIFAGRRIPEDIKNDPVLYGECLGGALYIEDFRRMLRGLGCPDYRVISKRKITIADPGLKERIGQIDFYSMTVRAFKLDDLEDACEDYGQIAVYLGTIPDNRHQFLFDNHHLFITNKPILVCGNTASMLTSTRYAPHFRVTGNRTVHYGPFPCGPSSETPEDADRSASGSCC